MKEELTAKQFCDIIQSAIGENLELEEIFISSFKKDDGGEKCQLKK